MRLKDLRPCALCGGAIVPFLWTLKIQRRVIKAMELNQNLSMLGFFGGNMAIADVFSPSLIDSPVTVEKEFFICESCFIAKLGILFDQLELHPEFEQEADKAAKKLAKDSEEV